MSIWFPRLASDVSLRRHPVEGPFALTLRAGNADHLHCVNPAAMTLGLARGMALADARAICPDLVTRPADLVAEAAALGHLRRWASRYAPMVARDGADGLMADISGVPHLFGGEEALRDDLHARMERAGLAVVSAVAGTRGAAHGLARHGGGGVIADGKLAEGIGPLPVAALRIDQATAEGLSRVGLNRIADLLPLPRAPLARRFGAGLVLRLDQALGAQTEPVAAEADAPHFGVRMTLPEPIGKQEDVMAGLARLLDRLCARLALHQMGARRLRLDLRRVDRATVQLDIGLAQAMRDPLRIAALFRRGIDEVDAGFGIDALRLCAPVTEPLAPAQLTSGQLTPAQLTSGQPAPQDGVADLVTRLGNRLGFDAIQRLAPAESLIPERSFLTLPTAYSAPAARPRRPRHRPLILFPPEPVTAHGQPPARFRWRRMSFTTLRATGPERISPEWWFDDPAWRTGLRDYWRIDTREGPRLWLFQTPQTPGWYAQGEFA